MLADKIKKGVSPAPAEDFLEQIDLAKSELINYDSILRYTKLELVAEKMIEGTYGEADFMKKDTIDKFLEFVHTKVQTGYLDIPSMAYPTRRMMDKELEKKIIELINVHLYPEIVLRLLKFFARNVYDSDSNLYIANLIQSEDIIRSIFETFKLFRKDIFIANPDKRALNVKRMQQFSPRTDNRQSSPLDASCRLKYILEFLSITHDTGQIYTKEDLVLFRPAE